jgi:membrane-bound lytic murein transglycosylase D
MEKNAAEYGLEGIQLDSPLEYDTVEILANTSLNLVADITEIPVAELADLNPAVLRGMVPENYSLHVPKGSGNQLAASLQMVPAEHRDSWRMHRVGAGETVVSVAKLFGASPSVIGAANNLHSSEPVEGDRLLIPAALRVETPARQTVSRAPARRTAVVVHHATGKTPPAKGAAVKPQKKAPVSVARSAVR